MAAEGAGTPGEHPNSGRGEQQGDSPSAAFSSAPSAPPRPPPHVESSNEKQWNYSGLDLMGSGAAFWQNYSGKNSKKLIYFY